MEKKPIVLSGIRATGHLHLGNYYGALRNFVEMQNDYDCRYFIADYHSLTTAPDPTALNANIRSILAEYLAAGMDPEKCMVYVQSDVPETCEFYTLLNMHAYLGELERVTAEVRVSVNYDVADMRDAAERLRREAERRRAELEAYGEAVGKKRTEVEKIHPKLAGVIQALTPYATGEIGITDPVDTCDMILRTFVPEVTDANAKAIEDFKPVRRSPPDTAAIRKTVNTGAISRLVEAQARYETACRKLADAMKDHIDRRGKLLLEANKEQKSVEAAVALQNKRDAV